MGLLKKIEFERFMSQGCMYEQRCWTEEDFKNRWEVYLFENEESTNLKDFHPWCLTEEEMNKMAQIPGENRYSRQLRYRRQENNRGRRGRGQKRGYGDYYRNNSYHDS